MFADAILAMPIHPCAKAIRLGSVEMRLLVRAEQTQGPAGKIDGSLRLRFPPIPDFWNLEPIGSIYAHALNVVDQDVTGAVGLPGASHSVMWFGADYHGEFYAIGFFARNSSTISAAAWRALSAWSGGKLIAPTRASPPPP